MVNCKKKPSEEVIVKKKKNVIEGEFRKRLKHKTRRKNQKEMRK